MGKVSVMRKKRLIKAGLAAMILLIYLAAGYLQNNRTPSYEGLLGAIANCGTFIQASFKNIQRSQWDYFIVLVAVIVVIATLFYSVKYLVKPNEGRNHIKHQILEELPHGKDS